jgi:hypothetical protein
MWYVKSEASTEIQNSDSASQSFVCWYLRMMPTECGTIDRLKNEMKMKVL